MNQEEITPIDATAEANQLTASSEKATTNGRNPVAAGVESALRATIGLFSMGKEEAEAIINRMIERGELAEKDGRRILSGLYERPKQSAKQVNQKVESVIDDAMLGILNMLNVPTRSDLQSLTEKINELAEKVEALSEKISS